MKLKTVAVIPARIGSTRFPEKPLALLDGRPMIQWVIEGARKSKLLDDVIVATDDLRIVRACQEVSCKAVMTKPDWPSGTDRLFEASQSVDADVLINVQGDEPFISDQLIDPLVQAFIGDSKLQMATLAHPFAEESELYEMNSVKVIVNQDSNAIYFSRFAIPHSRRSAKEMGGRCGSFKHIGLYGYTKTFLKKFCETPVSFLEQAESLEQLRAIEMGTSIRVIFVDKPTLGVDTPEDLIKAQKWLEEKRENAKT